MCCRGQSSNGELTVDTFANGSDPVPEGQQRTVVSNISRPRHAYQKLAYLFSHHMGGPYESVDD